MSSSPFLFRLAPMLLMLALTPVLAQTANSYGLPSNLSVGGKPFNSQLRLNEVAFTVSSPNTPTQNTVKIIPTGLKVQIDPIELPVDSQVTGAELSDLNNDGYPEVYVYLNTADAKAYGSVLGYASNRNLSLTPIYMPTLAKDSAMAKGYNGGDAFAVVESNLVRRFPTTKTHGEQRYRQISYRLVAGEAGWLLKPQGSNDF